MADLASSIGGRQPTTEQNTNVVDGLQKPKMVSNSKTDHRTDRKTGRKTDHHRTDRTGDSTQPVASEQVATRCYGETAFKLVKEAIRSRDASVLTAYKDHLVRDILLETKHLHTQLEAFEATIQGLRPKHPLETTQNIHTAILPLETACAMHSLALARNKRCVLAYQRQRIDHIVAMLWESSGGASTASSLPPHVLQCMSVHESTFVAGYKALASDFRGHFLDIDLGVGLVPPRTLFTEIRVVRDCGEITTDEGVMILTPGAQLYVKRCDVEDFIMSGDVREIS
ncbi:hypothetical protein BASA50_004553 [Batrachochytrium salamandrivorans]|uniref:DNA replication complex GINS protein PSF1 n=1 Tax=Batrachochytrium salamandrivorans TaxID=1357716 RepID=A0ABQ8FF07_9FUNG|nr:hypothetical protein BASA62_006728 [Batrachochytrium salamandrivorans]KAH6579076.1 hypothetical protein BASA61_010489 [Batrachochytrium salamandrivorans]KAH6579869.1 hypothetical protein BASA60_003105 [Batrachochytrium salamandrivorans]KAH6597201.1 hypothetical protein BASA50_004553 [Batrachochytrium salamandrivorans]KAH9245202.1 hypothetical protein BASA81_017321 [Batrachochytrium salamandrivorans]